MGGRVDMLGLVEARYVGAGKGEYVYAGLGSGISGPHFVVLLEMIGLPHHDLAKVPDFGIGSRYGNRSQKQGSSSLLQSAGDFL